MKALGGLTVVGGILVSCVALGAASPPQIAQGVQGESAIGGPWRLNKELSSSVSELLDQPEPGGPDDVPSEGGPRGRMGGRMGRPGLGGGPMGRDGLSARRQADQRKVRVLMDELRHPPERMALLVKEDSLIVTESTGVIRTYAVGGKATDVMFNGEAIKAKATWHERSLVVELVGGPLTLTRTYEALPQGRQLLVTTTARRDAAPRGGRGQNTESPPPLRFVYDRE